MERCTELEHFSFIKCCYGIDTLMTGWCPGFTTNLCPQQFGSQHPALWKRRCHFLKISCQQCSERLPVIRIILNFENALWQRKRRWKKSRQIILSREVPTCFFPFLSGARSTKSPPTPKKKRSCLFQMRR